MAEAHPADGARRRIGGYALALVVLVWVLMGVALLTIIGMEAVNRDDRGCPVPGVATSTGEEHWQWWPPGEVCTFGDARLVEPDPTRAMAILFEVVVGLVLLVLWRRYRDAPDPDWAT